ncbi:hypothetical protein C8R43DRAFT_1134682 [Mycena crocata]|nr:hypothetical protein C8R43DRAFT_1134682 [Mycena crocata]
MSYGALEGECPGGVEGASPAASQREEYQNLRLVGTLAAWDGGIGRTLGGGLGGHELAGRLPVLELNRAVESCALLGGKCGRIVCTHHLCVEGAEDLWLSSEVRKTCGSQARWPYDAPIAHPTIVHSLRQVRKTCGSQARWPGRPEIWNNRIWSLISRLRAHLHPSKISNSRPLPKSTMTRFTRSHGPAPTPPPEVIKSRSGKKKKKTPAAQNPDAQEATAAPNTVPSPELVDSQGVPTTAEEVPPPPPVSKAASTFLGVYVPPPTHPVPRPLPKKESAAPAKDADPADTFNLSGRRYRGPGGAQREEEATHQFDDCAGFLYDDEDEEDDDDIRGRRRHSRSPTRSPRRSLSSRSPSTDSLLLSPRVHQGASSPPPASHYSLASGAEDDYGEQQAQAQRVQEKLAARGYPTANPEEEDEQEDLRDLMEEAEANGVGSEDENERRRKKKKAATKAKKEKEKEKERKDDASSDDEDEMDDAAMGYKAGPVPKEIEDAVHAAYAAFEETIEDLARQCDKSPTTLHQLVGSIVKLSRAETPYNVWQMYHAEKYLKGEEEPMTPAEYNRLCRTRYLEKLTELPAEDRSDAAAVWAHLPWLRTWHQETMSNAVNNWRGSGKLRAQVHKGIKPILQIIPGIHVWGYVIDTDSHASMAFGAGEVFKNVKTNQMLDLNRQMKDMEHIFGVEEGKLRGAKVFGAQLLPSELESKDTEAARDNARKLFGRILVNQMVSIQIVMGTMSTEKAKSVKHAMQWGDKFLDTAWQNKLRLVNWPKVLAKDGKIIGGGKFSAKKLQMKHFDQFLPAMVSAERGEDVEGVMAIVPWTEEEKELSLEDQREVPLVVSDTDDACLRTVAESNAYNTAVVKAEAKQEREAKQRQKAKQTRGPSGTSRGGGRGRSPSPRYARQDAFDSRATDSQDFNRVDRRSHSRASDQDFDAPPSRRMYEDPVQKAPAPRVGHELPLPSRHRDHQLPPPSRYTDRAQPPAPSRYNDHDEHHHPAARYRDDRRAPSRYTDHDDHPAPSRFTDGYDHPAPSRYAERHDQPAPGRYAERYDQPYTSSDSWAGAGTSRKNYGALGRGAGPSKPMAERHLPSPPAQRASSSRTAAPEFDRAASLARRPPPPPVDHAPRRRRERDFEVEEQPAKRVKAEVEADTVATWRCRFATRNSDGELASRIFHVKGFKPAHVADCAPELKWLMVEKDDTWKLLRPGYVPNMETAKDLAIYEDEICRYNLGGY